MLDYDNYEIYHDDECNNLFKFIYGNNEIFKNNQTERRKLLIYKSKNKN